MKNFVIFISILLLATSSSCAQSVRGSKQYITREVNVSEFNHIKVTGSPSVYYRQTTGAPEVEIYGSDNIVDLLEVYVDNKTLFVKFKPNTSIMNPGKLEVRVSAKAPDMFEVVGSGDIYLVNGVDINRPIRMKVNGSGDISGEEVRCPELNIKVSGSGDVKLSTVVAENLSTEVGGSGDIHVGKISSKNVKARVGGSGDIGLKGKCVTATYHVGGSGDIYAADLKASDVNATVSGSGDIRCSVSHSLDAYVKGSGDIRYKGNPEKISTSKKGVSRL